MDAHALSLTPISGFLTLVVSAVGTAVLAKLPTTFLRGTTHGTLPAGPGSGETA